MPDLPTLTITQSQADRCLAAWGSVAAYKAWLKGQVAGYVVAKEAADRTAEIQAAVLARYPNTGVDPLDGAT